MPSIKETIIINANVKKVLETFHNFKNYPSWSKFMTSIEITEPGKTEETLSVGDSLKVVIFLSRKNKETVFTPIVTENSEKRFAWNGVLLSSWIFGGNHSFQFESIDENTTKLIQGEVFSGAMASPIFWMLGESTAADFKLFNEALKAECEK